jgi:hypothetical protein
MEGVVCPTCARAHPPNERFCEDCGMPLVHASAAEQVVSERQQKARKIKPQYAEGELVKVAHADSQPEAEFIAGLLLEEGIPCVLRNLIGGVLYGLAAHDVLRFGEVAQHVEVLQASELVG